MKKLFVTVTLILTLALCSCGRSPQTTPAANENTGAESSAPAAAKEEAGEKDRAADESSDESSDESLPKASDLSSETGTTIDLSGCWKQENKEESETHMVAYIAEGVISVFFILEDDDSPWTYWVGTYAAPGSNEHTWTSQNIYTGHGLLASTADEKEFAYHDGTIAFEVSMAGETNTIKLVPGEWDMSNVSAELLGAAALEGSASDADALSVGAPLQADGMAITDSGYCIKNGYLYGFVTIENSSESTAYDFPKYRVTAFNKDGNVLGTEEQTLSRLDPLCSFTFGSLLFDITEEPDRVEFELLPPEEYALEAASPDDALLLEVDGTMLTNGKITGMIHNPNDETIDTAVLCVICYDAEGSVIDINDTFVDDIPAGGSAPFEISVTKEDFSEFCVFAGKWM